MYQFMTNAWYLFSAIGALALAVLVIVLLLAAIIFIINPKDDVIPVAIRELKQAKKYAISCSDAGAISHINIALDKLLKFSLNEKQQKW